MKCPYRKKKTATYNTEYDDHGNVEINNLEEEIEDFEDCLCEECPLYKKDDGSEICVKAELDKKNFSDTINELEKESNEDFQTYVTDLVSTQFVNDIKNAVNVPDYHKILKWLALYGARHEKFGDELLKYFDEHYEVKTK